ncbi:folylpolyglutamate synthase/dihydrofolate synthase family protein [Lutibacter sp.]|uniref:bifunctional folylpolyglutamate synthase/dihydrofolate synthase n=1 Tax=Lutibacter sp. TaxID=1925666 RepID=UPI0027374095|nr:folylpolyglutamate synthase/dihydrofolate synthase family protein [Lutibacter sp.]MDP3313052.1 folylpolyglutamate synthase/dihydrofolate synthase family protein [Lutibacter sp.]
MKYKETLDWMFLKLPMYQRVGSSAIKKDLTNSIAFSTHLNFPENKFKSVHVAGTNGKGSTSHMLASILQEAGYKVGLYTSPHLKDFRERIRVNGKVISKKQVTNFIESNQDFLDQHELSFFEMTVGMAFYYFAFKKVDIAIVEVGMGGRLDSTNIITPLVSVITNIGLDHTQFLGDTLSKIAFEKAGIIKPNVPVVIGEYHDKTFPVFEKKAQTCGSTLYLAEVFDEIEYESDLKGLYQQHNKKTVVTTIEVLKDLNFNISEEHIKEGFLKTIGNTGLMGRWQVLNDIPKVICDTGHNKEGLFLVMQQLKLERFENLHIVLGMVNDKKLEDVLPLFPKNATYYFCKPNIPRGLDEKALKEQCFKYELIGNSYNSVKKAYKTALKSASENDLIFIGGSTFVVAEVV